MLDYREIWLVDFEYLAQPGEHPVPICLCAKEIRTGRVIQQWRHEMGTVPPYPLDRGSLFVSYHLAAEYSCHLALGWKLPESALDLLVEFRSRMCGRPKLESYGLVAALLHFGLDTIGAVEKRGMVDLILAGGPWTEDQRDAILDYCLGDVLALERLLPAMLPRLKVPYAVMRARYLSDVARIERTGVPIDVPAFVRVASHWADIQLDLIRAVDANEIYDERTFKLDRFEALIGRHQIAWPRHESGNLDLSEDTFRQMAKLYPAVIAPLHELRYSLAKLRLNKLTIGKDGRNRASLFPYKSKTGRNQPSSAQFIFGPATWLRGFIRPPPGSGLAYVDYEQQEFGIGAALSGDRAMQDAYASGDPYLRFAQQAGAIPADGSKATHGPVRELYKVACLAVQYGMTSEGLATRIGQPPVVAHELLLAHRLTYRRFWKWNTAAIDYAVITGALHTVLGWTIQVGPDFNPRSLQNFPMQGNGSEILRLAIRLVIAAGVELCAPIHDALLICAPLDRLDEAVATTRECMAKASRFVLDGFEIRTDAKLVRYPDRYMDPRGAVMWQRVTELVNAIEQRKSA